MTTKFNVYSFFLVTRASVSLPGSPYLVDEMEQYMCTPISSIQAIINQVNRCETH